MLNYIETEKSEKSVYITYKMLYNVIVNKIKEIKKMTVNEMKENLEFYEEEFDSLLDAIKAYESGSEDYTKDDLDEKTDDLHEQICATVDLIVRRIIDKYNDYGKKIFNLKYVKDLAPIVEELFQLSCDCADLCYCNERFDLKEDYGNGTIDGIGCDFTFPKTDEFEYLYYSPDAAYQYLATYGLVECY